LLFIRRRRHTLPQQV